MSDLQWAKFWFGLFGAAVGVAAISQLVMLTAGMGPNHEGRALVAILVSASVASIMGRLA